MRARQRTIPRGKASWSHAVRSNDRHYLRRPTGPAFSYDNLKMLLRRKSSVRHRSRRHVAIGHRSRHPRRPPGRPAAPSTGAPARMLPHMVRQPVRRPPSTCVNVGRGPRVSTWYDSPSAARHPLRPAQTAQPPRRRHCAVAIPLPSRPIPTRWPRYARCGPQGQSAPPRRARPSAGHAPRAHASGRIARRRPRPAAAPPPQGNAEPPPAAEPKKCAPCGAREVVLRDRAAVQLAL